MRPTGPLLLITVLQGLSGGMAVALTTALIFLRPSAELAHAVRMEPLIIVVALAGGVASFFHMHRIQAARFVLRRLKTSWLSREALTTGLYIGGLTGLAAGIDLGNWHGALLLGTAAGVAGLGLVAMFVTAMLYSTITAMRSWHSPLTVIAMMGVGVFSGWLVMAAIFAVVGTNPAPLREAAAVAVVLGLLLMAVKAQQWHFFAGARTSVMASTGTGLPLGPHRLQDSGTSRIPYKTQTQIWPDLRPGPKRLLYGLMFLLLTAVPVAAMGAISAGASPAGWFVGGAVSAVVGAFLERWLFFADATHSSRVWFTDHVKRASRVATHRGSPALLERYRRLSK
ncbi:MAG: dimethyl sulfoxide reductase anchor subunit [Thermaerobacter sp.]|nr:dimethyl sulfoxide reductase anchor subunit [Thermaerobacter sp.]